MPSVEWHLSLLDFSLRWPPPFCVTAIGQWTRFSCVYWNDAVASSASKQSLQHCHKIPQRWTNSHINVWMGSECLLLHLSDSHRSNGKYNNLRQIKFQIEPCFKTENRHSPYASCFLLCGLYSLNKCGFVDGLLPHFTFIKMFFTIILVNFKHLFS